MAASSKNKKSGNPAKRDVTTAKGWKRNKGEELELPSGNVALVKRPGPQSLLSKGILPDTLMPIVQQAIRSGKGLKPEDTEEILKDPERIAEMLDGMDRLLVEVVVEPSVRYHKELVDDEWVVISEDERDNETYIYTDDIDMDDKMFVFNYAVGGTRDLERFREEQASRVGDVPAFAGNEDSPESAD